MVYETTNITLSFRLTSTLQVAPYDRPVGVKRVAHEGQRVAPDSSVACFVVIEVLVDNAPQHHIANQDLCAGVRVTVAVWYLWCGCGSVAAGGNSSVHGDRRGEGGVAGWLHACAHQLVLLSKAHTKLWVAMVAGWESALAALLLNGCPIPPKFSASTVQAAVAARRKPLRLVLSNVGGDGVKSLQQTRLAALCVSEALSMNTGFLHCLLPVRFLCRAGLFLQFWYSCLFISLQRSCVCSENTMLVSRPQHAVTVAAGAGLLIASCCAAALRARRRASKLQFRRVLTDNSDAPFVHFSVPQHGGSQQAASTAAAGDGAADGAGASQGGMHGQAASCL